MKYLTALLCLLIVVRLCEGDTLSWEPSAAPKVTVSVQKATPKAEPKVQDCAEPACENVQNVQVVQKAAYDYPVWSAQYGMWYYPGQSKFLNPATGKFHAAVYSTTTPVYATQAVTTPVYTAPIYTTPAYQTYGTQTYGSYYKQGPLGGVKYGSFGACAGGT